MMRSCGAWAGVACAVALISPAYGKDASPASFITVVKVAGIPWFDRMEVGVKQFAQNTGIATQQVGPPSADVQLQVQLLQDSIARSPKAIAVVPLSPEAVEPVLAQARARGIAVVTHEAPEIRNADFDIEPFKNDAYGIHLMDNLAKCMGYKGKYAVFVGSMTAKTHNQWVDAAVAHQRAAYPNMQLVGSKNESYDDRQKAHDKALALIRAYPDIKGFQGSSSMDAPGIGQAVEERGLAGQACVVGTALPSQTRQYLKSGAISMISFWDPSAAGYAMNEVARRITNHEPINDGDDLKAPGYGKVSIVGKDIYGDAWIDADKTNVDAYSY
jgi:simple sugar transport system substrate-binding protein